MRTIIKNISKFFLILILVNSCGYTPLFKDIDNLNLKINIIKTNGSRKINNIIISNLKNYTLRKSGKEFDISINTNYEKNIIAKDSTGAATEYKITLNSNFLIVTKNYEKELIFSESFNMQSMSNKLDENDYEENIQNSLVDSITKKLIFQLSQIQ